MTSSYHDSTASSKACPCIPGRSCLRSTSRRAAGSRRSTPACRRCRTATQIEPLSWSAFRATSSCTRTAEQIQEFCSLNYGVTFPLYAKLDVKGPNQHPLYSILSESADDAGKAGNVKWNFEKFLVGRDGRVLRRFRSKVVPEDPAIVGAIESLL